MRQLDKQAIRRKIMGTLLRHARLSAGRSQNQIAAALHVSKYRYGQYERGVQEISLPELERVAELCGVTLGYFFDDEANVEDETLEIVHEVAPRIRRKALGILLRQARDMVGRSQRELAALLGIAPNRVSQYENGMQEISDAELEVLASQLNVEVGYFSL